MSGAIWTCTQCGFENASGPVDEVAECQNCGGEWKCSGCGHQNPGDDFECVVCSVKRTRKAPVLVCAGETGHQLRIRLRTTLGKSVWSPSNEDAQRFLDDTQCVVEPNDQGEWEVVPNTGAPNETMLDGKAVVGRSVLHEGAVLGVGRESKGIVKLPMTVQFE